MARVRRVDISAAAALRKVWIAGTGAGRSAPPAEVSRRSREVEGIERGEGCAEPRVGMSDCGEADCGDGGCGVGRAVVVRRLSEVRKGRRWW